MQPFTGKEDKMTKKILTTTICAALGAALLLLPITGARAADKVGWVGPVYTELAESLTRGFKAYYQKTYGKEVDITFVHPGGWPVCVDKVKAWGGKPDADVFLGAGAPAHEVLKEEGLIIPYRPKHWDMVFWDNTHRLHKTRAPVTPEFRNAVIKLVKILNKYEKTDINRMILQCYQNNT